MEPSHSQYLGRVNISRVYQLEAPISPLQSNVECRISQSLRSARTDNTAGNYAWTRCTCALEHSRDCQQTTVNPSQPGCSTAIHWTRNHGDLAIISATRPNLDILNVTVRLRIGIPTCED